MRKYRDIDKNGFTILTVDDDEIMTATLQSYFQRVGFDVDIENNPMDAIEKVRGGNYDILLLDFLMSPICGDKVVEEIRKFNTDIYIILLTGHKSMAPPIKTIRELDIQGYYEKNEKFDQLELLVESCVKSIRQMRIINDYKQGLERANEEIRNAYDQMQANYMEMIETIRIIVDERDFYTRGHSDRVAKLAGDIARFMNRSKEETQLIELSGLFHDVGKVGISDNILLKPVKLTEEELKVIQQHPKKSAKILSALKPFEKTIPIVRAHHERFDGRGYPDGLKGDEIPLEAKIVALADAFDAMTSNRLYQSRISLDNALAQIRNGSGTQFDPEIVETFISMIESTGSDAFADKYIAQETEVIK